MSSDTVSDKTDAFPSLVWNNESHWCSTTSENWSKSQLYEDYTPQTETTQPMKSIQTDIKRNDMVKTDKENSIKSDTHPVDTPASD